MIRFNGMIFDSIWLGSDGIEGGKTTIYIGDINAPSCYTHIVVDEKELRQLGNQIKNYFDDIQAK